jgi:ATP-dependent helicase YprA (DUF1998 family)
MNRDSKRADAARTMTTLLRHQQRAGRFGRELRGDDVETYDDREEPVSLGYVVDPDAVAAAIVERLVAGRTLRLKGAKPG